MIKAISYFLLAIILLESSQSIPFVEPPSPCPNVFRYVSPRDNEAPGPGTEKWYGVANLTTDITLHALWLNVILDQKADVLGNWIGEVTTEDNLNFKIENTNLKLTPDTSLSIRFFIQYKAKDPAPKLQKILLNGQEICNAEFQFETNLNHVLNSNNYDGNEETVINNITSTTSTKKPFRRQTTVKPNWTAKLQNQQAVTESPSRLEVTKNENKASSTWGTVQSKIENKQTQKSADIDLSQYSQVIIKNNSQSILHSKSGNNKSTENSVNNNENLGQNYHQGTSKIWPEQQATTEANIHVVYGSSFHSRDLTWILNDQEQVVDNNRRKEVFNTEKVETQLWPQNVVDSDKNTNSRRQTSSHSSSENTYNKDWISTNNDNKSQKNTQSRPKDKPIVVTANPNYYVESNEHIVQVRPVNVDRHDEEVQVLPEVVTTSISPPIYSWSSDSDSTDLRFADRNTGDNNSKQSSGSRYQTTTNKQSSNIPVPVIEESVDYKPRAQEDTYFKGGIPTLYIPNQTSESSCGKVTKKPPRYLPPHSTTSEGQWPWQVALYQQQTVDFKYICAGTLVSYHHVLTAAHCVARTNSRREVNKNTLTVYLGKFNLRTSIEGVQIKFVSKIIIHPEYNAMTFSRDLAILELREHVSYTDWVRPACLWPGNETGLRSIVGKKGSIVGWGSDVSGVPKEELNLLEMQVVAQETCINSYLAFSEKFTSDYTYCASYSDGNSVCNGDSGGGMVFKKGNTWYLRGLASLSVARTTQYHCDPTQYVIFTDIAKLLPWIEKNID